LATEPEQLVIGRVQLDLLYQAVSKACKSCIWWHRKETRILDCLVLYRQ